MIRLVVLFMKFDPREISLLSILQYNFWNAPTTVGSTIDLVVPPHQFAHFGEMIEKFNLRTALSIDNLQE